MYKYIRCPKTLNLVNIYSNEGKELVKKYQEQYGGHNGPCALNTKTGRCKKV